MAAWNDVIRKLTSKVDAGIWIWNSSCMSSVFAGCGVTFRMVGWTCVEAAACLDLVWSQAMLTSLHWRCVDKAEPGKSDKSLKCLGRHDDT